MPTHKVVVLTGEEAKVQHQVSNATLLQGAPLGKIRRLSLWERLFLLAPFKRLSTATLTFTKEEALKAYTEVLEGVSWVVEEVESE